MQGWHGRLIGRGSKAASADIGRVAAPTDLVTIAAGLTHGLAVRANGTVWAWGSNAQGELGDGTTAPRSWPEQVVGLTYAVAVSAGDQFSLALKRDGTVWAWGLDSSGQAAHSGSPSLLHPTRLRACPT